MKEATDEQLMQAVVGGNLDALDELVLRYQSLAWRTAYRFLNDSMEAEDGAQETFLRILEAACRYRAKATFRPHFYRVLTRLCIDRTRKRKLISIEDIPEVANPLYAPVDNLIERERRAQIRNALGTLPSKQKAAIILKYYEDLSYIEIAQGSLVSHPSP